MARTRVRRRRLALGAALTMIAAAWAGPIARAGGAHEPAMVARTTYVVEPGDSVWSIAHELSAGGDPRTVVDAIVETNGIDPAGLVPGQRLVIPAG